MSDFSPLEPIVGRILEGQAPRQVRLAAARGALPLPRVTLARLYVALRQDPEEDVRREAEASLAALDITAILEVLGEPGCAPEVLDFFALRGAREERLAERIAFHRDVPDSALSKLAAGGSSAVIELVLTNQERLLRQRDLLDRLSTNPALRPDQRGRILELLDRAAKFQARAADAERLPDDLPADLEEAARLLAVDVGELYAASEIRDGEEFAQAADPELRNAYHRILTLNTAQKAILAMKGGREERMILIRDTNKIVSLSVLRNPRLGEDDVEFIARMRSVSEDILRQVGQSREWTKSYTVISALVTNPRTPQGVSTNFIPRLRNQELKRLAANHDVPELIRRMARRTLDTRTQQAAGGALRRKKK